MTEMVTRSIRCGLIGALALGALAGAANAQEGEATAPDIHNVLLTFHLIQADGFTDEVRAAVRSGLKTTFTYIVDLRLEVPVWVDRTIATAVIANSVEYDNLTRLHNVVRVLDGKVESTEVTDNEAMVQQLMTSFERLPLFRTSVLVWA